MLQRSEKWFAARVGYLTASLIYDAVAKTKKGEYYASREKYKAKLVAERLTGMSLSPDLSRVSAVQWGESTESRARSAYEFMRDIQVVETGFVPHPFIQMSGASPDSLIGDDGVLEIKCPNIETHIAYLKAGDIPIEYRYQMLFQIACTGRKWGDFVSFDPRLNYENQLLVVRLEPTPTEIAGIEEEAKTFLEEVAADELWLRNRGKLVVAENMRIDV